MNRLIAIVLLSSFAYAAPQKQNIGADFSKIALKTLLAIRDSSDISTEDMEQTEVAATTETDEEIIQALRLYELSTATLTQVETIVESTMPGKCFTGIKSALRARVWTGAPPECSKSAAKR